MNPKERLAAHIGTLGSMWEESLQQVRYTWGMACRVGILDDHRSFGEALCLALASTTNFDCVGVTTGCDNCRSMLLKMKPDVLVIDYQLIGMTGFECVDRLRKEGITVRTVMLTAHASSNLHGLAREHAVEQVLSKDSPLSELLQALSDGPTEIAVEPPVIAFSKRQREVLELMGKGLAPAEIADVLFVSIHTARRHVKDVMAILDAPTQLAAVTTALRDGLLIPERESTE